MRIEHYEGLNFTPALKLAVRGWLELLEEGLADNALGLAWDQNAFVAFDEDGEAVGTIVYQHFQYRKELWVQQGYVLPEHRGKGVYKELFAACVAKARELKAVRISGGTHPRNAVMRAAAEQQGRRETGIVTTFEVPAC